MPTLPRHYFATFTDWCLFYLELAELANVTETCPVLDSLRRLPFQGNRQCALEHRDGLSLDTVTSPHPSQNHCVMDTFPTLVSMAQF